MAAALLLTLLGVHAAIALFQVRFKEDAIPPRLHALNLLVQLPIFYISLYLAFEAGVFSRQLISPIWIGFGLLVGHAVFAVSLLTTALGATGEDPEALTDGEEPAGPWDAAKEAYEVATDFGGLWNFVTNNPMVLSRFIGVAFAEELIWRAGAQTVLLEYLGSPVASILIVSALFVVVHRHVFHNSLVVNLEFIGFALVLGVLYHVSGSFILVLVIHAMRDIEIAYLEFLIKVHELGDRDQAEREIEETYSIRKTLRHES
jgi:membrane protease YdiL (CAAX protease family)